MHNLDPNDMDALFREGAEQNEFPYNPLAWDMMEQKLEEKKRRKTIFWILLGLLFIIGAASVYYRSSDNSNEQTAQIEKTITEVKKVREEKINFETSNNTHVENQNSNPLEESTIDKEKYINTGSKVRSRNIVAQNSENTGSLMSNEVVSSSSRTDEAFSVVGQQVNIFTKEKVRQEDKSINSNTTPNEQYKDHINVPILSLKSLWINSERENMFFNLSMVDVSDPETFSKRMRYAITGYTSTDFSSVGLFSEYKAGMKLGAKVGVQFADKIQLDLGIAYSHKKYGSEGKEYNIEGGWETMVGIDPTWMDAKCNIIEIPLEASYYWSGYRNNSFFVNVGLSSYFLNSEWYGFKYDPTEVQALVDPNKIIDEVTMSDIPERNFHVLGSGKISIGYQKVVSPNLSFEVSPYVQVPLTGIGQGKVNLYNSGIQFAVKFNSK